MIEMNNIKPCLYIEYHYCRETPEPVDSRATSYSTSRPHSRAHLTDISCSPIVGSDEGSSGSGHNTVYSKERKTSTPGHKVDTSKHVY